MNVFCGPQDEGFPTVLMNAATGCKLAKLGWNKIEHQNTFFPILFSFLPYFWYPLNIEKVMYFSKFEVYMKTWFLYCFIKKWFHTILYHFNLKCLSKTWRPFCLGRSTMLFLICLLPALSSRRGQHSCPVLYVHWAPCFASHATWACDQRPNSDATTNGDLPFRHE